MNHYTWQEIGEDLDLKIIGQKLNKRGYLKENKKNW